MVVCGWELWRDVKIGDFTYVRYLMRYSTNFLLIPTLKFKHFLTPISTDMTSLLRKSIIRAPTLLRKVPTSAVYRCRYNFKLVRRTCTIMYVGIEKIVGSGLSRFDI